MRAVIQRVSRASVKTPDAYYKEISQGLLILLGIEEDDTSEDVEWLAGKVCKLRVFNDEAGVMNLSVIDARGEILVVSQFTLHASTRKGNRPSYIRAARPEKAFPLYQSFINIISNESGRPVKEGIFGAKMDVTLVNEGPVTIIIDTKLKE
jgi:D-tyrosyl-tRNA(Tyr) deacylase